MTLEEARERFSSPLLHGALAFAIEAHQSPTAGETQVSHPVAVAGLLQDAGCAEEVVAAGLLHDVVEDTPFTLEEIKGRFGEPVSVLVAAMTEDEGIEAYGLRKEEHRRRVGLRSGRTAAIYAADKLASLRAAKQEGHEWGESSQRTTTAPSSWSRRTPSSSSWASCARSWRRSAGPAEPAVAYSRPESGMGPVSMR